VTPLLKLAGNKANNDPSWQREILTTFLRDFSKKSTPFSREDNILPLM
jgi:hypothetical protein